jgi:hypothetical protein
LDLADEAVKLYFQDGTERPIQRPADPEVQETLYSGKKKRHTVKNNVLVNAQARRLTPPRGQETRQQDRR